MDLIGCCERAFRLESFLAFVLILSTLIAGIPLTAMWSMNDSPCPKVAYLDKQPGFKLLRNVCGILLGRSLIAFRA